MSDYQIDKILKFAVEALISYKANGKNLSDADFQKLREDTCRWVFGVPKPIQS